MAWMTGKNQLKRHKMDDLGHTKLILGFMNCSSQKEDSVGRKNKKENSEFYLKSMNLIKSHAKSVSATGQLKELDSKQERQHL